MSITETAMARTIVTELQRQGYITYQEVSLGYGGRRADIVGVRGPVCMVVECKTSLSMRLLDQLAKWRGHANLVVGATMEGRIGDAVKRFAQSEGCGFWQVASGDSVHEAIAPRLMRRADTRLRQSLREEHQSGLFAEAGSQGGYWTPFRSTVIELEKIVVGQPGIELRVAMLKIKHHYTTQRSAVSAIPALVARGVITTIRVEPGRPIRLYPVASQ